MSNALKEKPNAEALPGSGSASVITNGHYAPPPTDSDGKLWVRTSTLIQAEPETLYSLWRNVEKIPEWQEEIVSVTRTGDKTSHWVMRAGENKTIEWNSEILADEPGKRIAWRSTSGDSENAGEVIFEPHTGNRGTMVTVLQEFRMSKLAAAAATVASRNPKQAVIENLRHFKALAETGEIPRVEGQSHGPRGAVGKMKESMYGENVSTPPGDMRKAS